MRRKLYVWLAPSPGRRGAGEEDSTVGLAIRRVSQQELSQRDEEGNAKGEGIEGEERNGDPSEGIRDDRHERM